MTTGEAVKLLSEYVADLKDGDVVPPQTEVRDAMQHAIDQMLQYAAVSVIDEFGTLIDWETLDLKDRKAAAFDWLIKVRRYVEWLGADNWVVANFSGKDFTFEADTALEAVEAAMMAEVGE